MLQSLSATIRRSPSKVLLALCLFAVITGTMVRRFLMLREPWRLLVDLDVYREAGVSVLIGRPVYDYLTPTPQLLPFTYPPISALLSMPLTLLPLWTLGWVWTGLQMSLLAGIVTVTFRPFLDRFGSWRPVALAVLTGLLLWLEPMKDGILFGQVDIILVALCFADYVAPRGRWPRGMLVGIATAVKLTPGVFIVHLWLSGRRREAVTAALTAAGLTLTAFLVIPGDSADYWFRAVLDSDRLGSNGGTSNQAIRGWLIRFGPDNALLWLALVAVVGYFGFRLALRCSRVGDHLAACAVVGMLAVLLSPVAWIHHMAWVVLVLAVILGDGRDVRRLLLAVGLGVFFFVTVPWKGSAMVDPDYTPHIPIILARMVQDAFGFAAVVLMPVVTRYAVRDAARAPQPGPSDPTPREPVTAGAL